MLKETFIDPHNTSNVSWYGFFFGILILAICIFTDPPAGMSKEAWSTVGMAGIMAVWWATEAIPIPATSLLPVILIPLLGIAKLGAATAPYANPTIFLFLGGFIIGLALERWNLHKRIALATLLAVGDNPRAQIGGFMIVTAFISMWVSNTATAIMMLPIGISVIKILTDGKKDIDDKTKTRFAVAILLGIAYAASIGGMATIIGTPPNAILVGQMNQLYGMEISFAKWMIVGLPLSVIVLFMTWIWLTRGGFKLSSEGSRDMLKEEFAKLGKMSRGEKLVGLIFILTSLAWIFQPLLKGAVPGINDTVIAIIAALVLFITPENPKKRVFLMDWNTAKKLPWDVLLLFGGGLSMAGVIKSSGLSSWIAENVGNLVSGLHIFIIILIVVLIIQILTELTSNTATAATFFPLMAALAVGLLAPADASQAQQGISALILGVPTVLAASCAFMLPVATPPNAVVFGSGLMPISSMIRNGMFLTFGTTLIITILAYYLVPLVWN